MNEIVLSKQGDGAGTLFRKTCMTPFLAGVASIASWLAFRKENTRMVCAALAGKRLVEKNKPLVQRTIDGLLQCLPELPEREREAVIHVNAMLLAKVAIDRFWFLHATHEQICARVALRNPEILASSIGEPLIVLCPHFVGLEAFACRIAVETRGMAIYRPRSNQLLEYVLQKTFRRLNKQRLLSIFDLDIYSVVSAVRAGLPLFLSPDINISGSRSQTIKRFIGCDYAFETGFERIAKLTGARIVVTIPQVVGDSYACEFSILWEPSGLGAEDLVARYAATLESHVRQMPEQYVWMN